MLCIKMLLICETHVYVCVPLTYLKSWYSVVGMVIRLHAGRSGAGIPAGARDFSLPINVQTSSGANLASCFTGTDGSFTRVKWLGCKVDHSPPSSALVNNEWSCTLHSLYMPLLHVQGKLYIYLSVMCVRMWEDTNRCSR
jgi:hypothetical protein